MVTLLVGENSYEKEQMLGQLVASFDGEAERFDGAELELRQLPDLLTGQTLFSDKRLVVIRGLSANKQVWESLPELLERLSDEIQVVLVESAPDKRTRAYKALQKNSEVKDFQPLGERDRAQAERWIMEEAKRMDAVLDNSSAKVLLARSFVMSEKGQPVLDQWQAKHSLEKLSVLDTITPAVIEAYIDEQPTESVFSVFETALKGDSARLRQLVKDIEPREDPFRVFGLLSGQVFQLAALSVASVPTAEVAKAISVHPYALGKLISFADTLTKHQIKEIVGAFTEADEAMKLSKAGPWVLLEQALMKTAFVAQTK